MKIVNKTLLGLSLLLIAGASFAQAEGADPTGSLWTNLASITNDFYGQFNLFQNADKFILNSGLDISKRLQSTALALGGAIALINILWIAIEHFVLKSRESILGPMLFAVVVAAIAGAALQSYSTTLAPGAISFFMSVSNMISGDASVQQVQSIGNQLTNLTINGIKSALQSLRGFSMDMGANILVIVDLLFVLVIGFFCLVVAMLMFVSVVSSIFTGTLMAGIAIALGPLFISTITSSFTKVFFDRWLGFFCSALFVKVVVMTMLALMVGIFQALTPDGGMGGSGFTFGRMLVLAVSLWIMKQLMEQAPNIASALMPGGLGVGVKGSIGTAVAAASGLMSAGLSASAGSAAGAIAKAGGGEKAAAFAEKANAAAASLIKGAANNALKSSGLSPGSTQRSGPAARPDKTAPTDAKP